MSDGNTRPEDDDEMLPEYDLTGGVRGKYVERYRQGTNFVLFDPDVAKIASHGRTLSVRARSALRTARD